MGENIFDTNRLINFQKIGNKDIEGFTTIYNLIEFPRSLGYFTKLKVLYPSRRDYETALELSKSLFEIGKNIPAVDKLIASIAYNLKLTLISKDRHFDFIKEIWEDFQISQEYFLEKKKKDKK
ncbi:MAG: type II toxin-antitoxin system VapC family toxin [Promethearchaeota archaeon]